MALEFTRPPNRSRKEPERETWGIRLEFSSPDARPKHTYFFIPGRLEYADIAPEARCCPRMHSGPGCAADITDFLYARQRDYLKKWQPLAISTSMPRAFHRTFPKAIAFEPEENVERFIREFILEESPLDVREVRAALRAYDDTRKRLEKQEDEAAFLRRIGEQHARYETTGAKKRSFTHRPRAQAAAGEERRDRTPPS